MPLSSRSRLARTSLRNASSLPLRDAEALDEGLVDLRHEGLGHLVDLDRDLDRLAGQLRARASRPGSHFDFALFAGPHADQLRFELREHGVASRARWRPAPRLRPGMRSSPAAAKVSSGPGRRPARRARPDARCGAAGAGSRAWRRCRRPRPRRSARSNCSLVTSIVAEVRHDLEGGGVVDLAIFARRFGLDVGLPAGCTSPGARLRRSSGGSARRALRRGPAGRSAARSPWRDLAGAEALDGGARDFLQAPADRHRGARPAG